MLLSGKQRRHGSGIGSWDQCAPGRVKGTEENITEDRIPEIRCAKRGHEIGPAEKINEQHSCEEDFHWQ